jgi:hypothetical protein
VVLRHPSTGAEVTFGGPGTEPDPVALAAQRAWVLAMRAEIAAYREAWRALEAHPDARVRGAASELTAALAC